MSATGSLSTKSKASAPLQCKWSGCEAYKDRTEFVGVDELARHVRMNHVEPLEVRTPVEVEKWPSRVGRSTAAGSPTEAPYLALSRFQASPSCQCLKGSL